MFFDKPKKNSFVIAPHEIGLLFKKGALLRILHPGEYETQEETTLDRYDITKQFSPPSGVFTLLKNKELEAMLEVVNVLHYELVFFYERGIFRYVLAAGTYVFWKAATDFRFERIDMRQLQVSSSIDRSLLVKPEINAYLQVFFVEQHEKGLLLIDKQKQGVLDPGSYFYWKNGQNVQVLKADMRQQQFEISGQEIMSKDKVTLRLNMICQYLVRDPEKVLFEIKEHEKQLYGLVQLVLREYVGGLLLDELLEKKEEINRFILDKLREQAASIGLEIIYAGIRDVILPGDIKEILNQVLIAEKRAQANVIMRREETASTRSLLNTAKLMEDNELLYKLKELEYVERITDKINQINLSGGGHVIEQLREVFMPQREKKKD